MLRHTVIQLLLITTIAVRFALASDNQNKFAPFGPSAGDTTLALCDDCSSLAIPYNFMFYGALQTTLFVNNNGIISFTMPISTYTPEGAASLNYPAILPFWSDVDTRALNGGLVYYRASTDPVLLANWSSQVPSNFHGNSAFIVTWDHVGYYYQHADKLDTFQAILITDGTNSWCFFNYGLLQWATGDASGGSNGFGGTPASIGFTAGDHTRFVQTSASLTNAVVNTTNFVTLVSGSIIQLSRCGDGVVNNGEQCDGGSCCTSNCTYVDSTSCFCARQNLANGQMGYYCNANGGFYQCVGGVYASQSRNMNCATGTHCGCSYGQECSCHLAKSPCVAAGNTQSC